MKKGFLVLLLACIGLAPAAARGEGEGTGLFDSLRGSGNIIEKELDFRGFSSVSVSHGMKLEVHKGSGWSVRLRADDNLIDVVRTEKSGGSLRFFLPPSTNVTNVSIEIRIEMPALEGIQASGGSRVLMDMDGMKNDFSVGLSGGSRMEGRLGAGALSFDLSGGSTVTIEGTGRNLIVNGSGGSSLKGFGLQVRDAEAHLSGGSWLETTLSGNLSVNASGGSRVIYAGSANVSRQELSGGSRVEKK